MQNKYFNQFKWTHWDQAKLGTHCMKSTVNVSSKLEDLYAFIPLCILQVTAELEWSVNGFCVLFGLILLLNTKYLNETVIIMTDKY